MFTTIKKNILLKLVILSAFFITITLGINYLAEFYDVEEISFSSFTTILIVIILSYTLLFAKLMVHPLCCILKEIKCLLTGRKYNLIYTNRIDEVGIIAHFFNEITHSLERVSADLKEQRRMSAELNIAHKIQRDLLPKVVPEISGLSLIAKSKSAAEIGGDSFDFIEGKGDNTIIYLGDVTGHGVPSGLVMSMVDTLITTFCDMYDNTYDIITKTNKYLKPLINNTMFMTMVILRWHKPTRKMYYTGAGHEYIIHYQAKTKKCEIKKAGGIALGMIPDNRQIVKEEPLPFEPDDILLLYSDGLTEARNLNGELFGIKKITKIIEQTKKNDTIEDLYRKISMKITSFTNNHIQEDDRSLMIIRNKEEKISEDVKNTEWNFENYQGYIQY